VGSDPGFNLSTAREAFAAGMAACAFGLIVLLAVTFGVGRALRRHSVVDVAWGLGFVLVAVFSFNGSYNFGSTARRVLLLVMVMVWGLRLAGHIARRGAGHGEDPRYEKMLARVRPERRTVYALGMIYLLQAVLIFVISLPVQAGSFADGDVGPVAILGVAVWTIGLVFEAVGDWQLQRFKADPGNKGAIMKRGLWRYTRHPNYFGDACVWWGIWLVAAETGIGALTVLSPIVMTLFLTKGSGAAMTERRMAGRPGFDSYVARTSPFLPWPPRRG
jgi:steroid 5-alpha reductase family enzyme